MGPSKVVFFLGFLHIFRKMVVYPAQLVVYPASWSFLGAILGVPWLMLGYLERVLGPLGAILEAILRYLGGSRAG